MTHVTAYHYRAARRDGATEMGIVEAASRDGALALLAGRGLFPIDVHLNATPEKRRRSLPPAELALGLRLLATLLEAGLPMSRALAIFDDLAPAAWKPALSAIRDAVREGKSLAGALAGAPVEIPSIVLGIVQAGEAGSGLAVAVRRAAEISERAAATRAAIRSALAYPLILCVAGAGSLGLLVGVVLPRFATILADLGQTLPSSTRLVLQTAGFLRAATVPGFVATVLVLGLWRAWVTSVQGRERWHELLLRMPLLGAARRSAATARLTASLGALLDSGVPIAPALVHAAHAGGDAALAARLLRAREAIVTGARVARALEREQALTPTAIKLVRAGEETGRLGAMLAHAAKLEAESAERTVRATVNLIEPALIIVFGAAIALTAASLLQAVYSVRPTP